MLLQIAVGGGGAFPAAAQTSTPMRRALLTNAVEAPAYSIVLTAVGTEADAIAGLAAYEPTNELVTSTASEGYDFELIASDGMHRSFSAANGIARGARIASARADGGAFRAGDVFAAAGNRVARVSADGATVQSAWATLPGETSITALTVDRTGAFGGEVIAVTAAGNVWRVNASAVATRVAAIGAPLGSVTTLANDAGRHGPWAGCILAGAAQQPLVYAVGVNGTATAFQTSIVPHDLAVVPAHENFFGSDDADRKLWAAPASAFAGMIGDVVVAQNAPGVLARIHWNGTTFESSELARVARWRQIAFSAAGVAEVHTARRPYDRIGVVRHAPSLSSGRVEGALWQLLPESVTIDGSDVITSDLLVPGMPQVVVSGNPSFGGTVEGDGAQTPSSYTVSIGGHASVGHLIKRTDAMDLPPVAAFSPTTNTRDVSITSASGSAGDFATLRDLSISGKAGAVAVPPGRYGRFSASGRTTFVFGVEGATEPSAYELDALTLSGGTELRVAGPVVLTVNNGVTLTGSSVGAAETPRNLVVRLAGGALRVEGKSVLYAIVRAPQSSVRIDGGGRLRGTLSCDRLELSGVLQLTETDIPPPPVNRPPAVEAGADTTITLPDAVTLTGSVGDDGLPGGSSVTQTWTRASGPADVVFAAPHSLSTTATFTLPGTYLLRLTASDGELASSDDVMVIVKPRNQAPVASAGPDQSIELPDGATLNGGFTDDGLPQSTVATQWTLLSGPGSVTFADDRASATSATFSAAGAYVLRLTANDGELSSSDDVAIAVAPENHPPAVNAGADQFVEFPQTLSLAGTATDDGLPAGSSLTTTWTRASGPGAVTFADASQPETTATFAMPGSYVLRLTATDGRFSISDDITITVDPTNAAPTVNAGADQTIELPATATLSGQVNDDGYPRGSQLAITWSGPEGVTFADAHVAATTATFAAAGTFTLQLTATDGAQTTSDTVTITVDPANVAPTVDAGADQIIALPATATLTGQVNDDGYPRGSQLAITWSGPEGVTFADAHTSATTATFAAAGTFTLQLTATDGAQTTSDTVTITVDPANAAPTVDAGADQIIALPSTATLTGQVHDDGYPRGSQLAITWSGPEGVTFADAHVAATTATFAVAGTFTLQLSATDGAQTTSDTVTITVDPSNGAPTVVAGADQIIALPATATLTGQVNDDGYPRGSQLAITWSGPEGVTFADAHVAATTATFAAAGTFTLQLTATDGAQTTSDTLVITVDPANTAPTVHAGADQTIELPATATLTASVDDTDSVTVQWTMESGPAAVVFDAPAERSTNVVFTTPGLYTLRVTASDGRLSSSDDVVVTVLPQNQPPAVVAGADQTVRLPAAAALSAVVSDDGNPAGATLAVNWSKISGPGNVAFAAAATPQTQATFSAAGTYVLRVTADDSVLQTSDDVTITVLAANSAPVVNAGADLAVTLPNATTLSGSGSDDGVPSPLTYQWTGPAGVVFATPLQQTTSATFAAPGTYVVRLTASDGEFSSSDEATVIVTAANTAPVVDAGADLRVNIGDTVTLSGDVTDDGLPSGNTLTAQWTTLSGPAVPSFTDANAAQTTATFPLTGIYVLRLIGSDGALSSSDDVTVAVVRPPVADFSVPAISRNVLRWKNNLASVITGATIVSQTSSEGTNVAANLIDDSPYTRWRSGSGQNLNQVITIRIGGEGVRTFERIRITNDQSATEAVKNFRFQISTTTADDAAFTTVLTSVLNPTRGIQEFALDAPMTARYVRFAFLDNYGATQMGVRDIEVVASGGSGLDRVGALNVADYLQNAEVVASSPWVRNPILALDGNLGTWWHAGSATNAFMTIRLIQESRIDRVVLASTATDGFRPRDFKVEVASDANGPFTNVLAATLANNDTRQEFLLPGGAVRARFVRLTVVNNYGATGAIVLNEFEVVSADKPSVSSMASPYQRPELMFDADVGTQWATPNGKVAGEFVIIHLTDDEPRLVDAVELQGYSSSAADSIKDFDVFLSTTTDDDGAFQLAVSGTVDSKTNIVQRFALPGGPARARYVKLVVKSNNGGGYVLVPTFRVLTVQHGGNLLTVPTPWTRPVNGSPALAANGATIVASTGSNAVSMLDYVSNSGWITSGLTNQFATIALGGDTPRTVSGVRIVPAFNGSGTVQNFEVWVSSTTTADSAFTKALTAAATTEQKIQNFLFPGGPVPVRYIKYVPLTRFGTATSIQTNVFDVILPVHPGGAVAASTTSGYFFPEGATSVATNVNPWVSLTGSNEWLTVAMPGSASRPVYGVIIEPSSFAPKDFDILISNTTPDDAAFTLVYSGTYAASQKTHRFGRTFDAKYVRFFFRNATPTGAQFNIRKVDVLSIPDDGGAVLGASAGLSDNADPSLAIDVNPAVGAWAPENFKTTDQTFTVGLPGGKLWRIDHVALQQGTSCCPYLAPRDFEIQVSAGDLSDASYVTVFRGTVTPDFSPEHCFFPAVSARAVRLLVRNNWGGNTVVVQNFWVYSPQVGPRTARFLDTSVPGARTIVAWSWTFGDGGTSTERDPVHEFPGAGTYEVALSVTDTDGLTTRRSMQYTVFGDPNVDFSIVPASPVEVASVLFTDTSTSPSGAIATSDWTFGDGSAPQLNQKSVSHTYADSGNFAVRHTVSDVRGVTATLTRTLTVADVPPTVSAGPDLSVPWGEPWGATPLVSDISNIDRPLINCHWDFGDGTSADITNCALNAAVVHRYQTIGTFTATLTATDKDGGTASDTVVTTTTRRPSLVTYGGARGVAADGSIALAAVLRDGLSREPLVGSVTFDVEGQTVTATTGTNGRASASLVYSGTATQPVVKVTYDGDALYSGRTTEVTLTCPASQQALDVAQVIDLSSSMTPLLADAKNAFTQLIDSLVPGRDQASTIIFSDSAEVRQKLTPDLELARKAVDTFEILQGTSIESGIYAATAELTGVRHNPAAAKVLILLSDGEESGSAPMAAASAAKAAGIHIISVRWKIPNSTTGHDTMAPLASSPSDFYEITTSAELLPLFTALPGTMCVAANAAPVTFAGSTQTTALPGATVILNGSIYDDGKPAGSVVTSTWTSVSGPAAVSFAAPNAPQTTATFTAAGNYVLRLTASDGELSGYSEVTVTVKPENQAPIADAGPDLTTSMEVDLLTNGDAEAPLAAGKVPGWTETAGTWTATTSGPQPMRGTHTLVSSGPTVAELIQDVDVTSYGGRIDAGQQQFAFESFVRVAEETPSDAAKIILEYRGLNNASVIRTTTTSDVTTSHLWDRIAFTETAPQGTRFIRIRLIAARHSGATNDVWFDAVSLRAVGAATVTTQSDARDDGQPTTSLWVLWTQLVGPSPASIFNHLRDVAFITATVPGTYTFRLAVDDTAKTAADEMNITVVAPNAAPVVSATADAAVTLPSTGTLAATAIDENAATLAWSWYQLSGPDAVIAQPHAATSEVTFSAPGTYVFRVYGDDGDRVGSAEVTVTVSPALGNHAPVVDAGPDLVVADPPRTAVLSGHVTDDGLPEEATLTYAWSFVSGPAAPLFETASQLTTNVYFPATGTYVLRLSSSDTNLIGSDDVIVNVLTNKPPAVNAGNDVVFTDSQPVPRLIGQATDGEIPPGGALTFQWTRLSGAGNVTFATPTQLSTSITLSAHGRYVFRLTATDGQLSASDDVVVTWDGANAAPTVNAGADQTVAFPATATLNAIVDDDGLPVGGALSIGWSRVSGPAGVTFTSPGSATTTATFTATGDYVLRITVTDGESTASDDIAITVREPLPAPVVEITSPEGGVTITDRTVIRGTVSDGAEWRLEYRLNPNDATGSGNPWTTVASGTGPIPSTGDGTLGTFDPTILLNGAYKVRLSATTPDGQSDAESLSVVVDGELKVGLFRLAFTDAEIALPGLPLQVARIYDSRDKRVGDFGVGWNVGVLSLRVEKSGTLGTGWQETVSGAFATRQYCLAPAVPRFITLTLGNDKVFRFRMKSVPECQALVPIETPTIVFEPLSGTYATLEAIGDTDVYAAGSKPGPVELMTLGGEVFNPTRFRLRLADGVIVEADETRGIEKMIDRNGNTLTFTANGIQHSAGRGITFTRDSRDRITEMTDAANEKVIYTYDSRGDLVKVTDQAGLATTFVYNSSHGLVEYFDAAGRRGLTSEYDENGRLIAVIDGLGNRTEMDFDPSLRREVVRDAKGRVHYYDYDKYGNLVATGNSDGPVASATYDDVGNVLTRTDGAGRTTTYTYDANGNVLTERDASGHTVTYTYNELSQITSVTDARNHQVIYEYDDLGNRISETDPTGKKTVHTYDDTGQVLTTTDPENKTRSFTYHPDGQLKSETDSRNQVTSYEYDPMGRITKSVDARGHATTFDYDDAGKLLTRSEPGGLVTTNEYDASGALLAVTDPNGVRTETESDTKGMPTVTTYANGTQHAVTYDQSGLLQSSTRTGGLSPSMTYDDHDFPSAMTLAPGVTVGYDRDALGRITGQTDPRNNTTTYTYNDFNRPSSQTNSLGQEIEYDYDEVGNVTGVALNGAPVVAYEYDEADRPTSFTNPQGHTFTMQYNWRGDTTKRTNAKGHSFDYTYDGEGHLTKVIEPGGAETVIEYDENGFREAIEDAAHRRTEYVPDDANRITTIEYPDGSAEQFTYEGTLLDTATDRAGQTVDFDYDGMGRQAKMTLEDGRATEYTYTATGQRDVVDGPDDSLDYDYDAFGRVTRIVRGDGSAVFYGYDAAGNRTSIATSEGTTLYTYDGANQMKTITDPQGRITEYAYDAAGQLERIDYPNGVTTTRKYDLSGNIEETESRTASDVVILGERYVRDESGNVKEILRHDGSSALFTYDALERLESETHKNSAGAIVRSISYTYDAVGNRRTVTNSAAVAPVTYAYDGDELTSDGERTFAYDANGDLRTVTAGGSDVTYEYDQRRHLTKVTIGGQSAVHVYDAEGRRVRTTSTAGQTTRFILDAAVPNARVIAEQDASRTPIATYTYGHEIVSMERNGETYYYVLDAHGSVRALTDSQGNVTDTYAYTAFGELASRTGTTVNPFAYAGEQLDADTGLYFLRARYYDPSIGRLTQWDSYPGTEEQPQSRNRYAYAFNNPVNVIDPSGRVGAGIAEHKQIGLLYILMHGDYYFMRLNRRPNKGVNPIVKFFNYGWGAFDRSIRRMPTGNKRLGTPGSKPDLRHYATGEVHEIKPLNLQGWFDAPTEAWNYVCWLNLYENDLHFPGEALPKWRVGESWAVWPPFMVITDKLMTFGPPFTPEGSVLYTEDWMRDVELLLEAARGVKKLTANTLNLLRAMRLIRKAPTLIRENYVRQLEQQRQSAMTMPPSAAFLVF